MPEFHDIASLVEDVESRFKSLRQSIHAEEKQSRLAEIEKAMSSPDFWNDQEKAQTLVQELKSIKSVLSPIDSLLQEFQDSRDLREMALEEKDQDTLAETEALLARIPSKLEKLETMALFSGAHDDEPCFFSIQTGAGGSDACEWTEMLLRMYRRFFEMKGWAVEELDLQPGEEAGIKSVDLRVSGTYVYGHLRGEMGVHRLVRISPFSGRRETSFAAVDVVPDYQKPIEIDIDDNDLRIDRVHATGKGGQHVNKTASAVRITHGPSGIMVMVQNERSQHRNKDMAMKILKSRLHQRAEAARAAKEDARNATKMDNAWGSQIRNYVMHPYQLVKDVRTGFEKGDIQKVLDGDIEVFIEAYLRWAANEANS